MVTTEPTFVVSFVANRANIELLLTGNYTIYTTIKYTVPAEYGEIELAPVISLLPKLRSFGLRLPLADKL